MRSRVHEYGGGAMCLVPGAVGRRVRLRRPGRPARVVLRRPGRSGPAPQPLTAPAPEGDVHNHGGLSAHGRRRLGPGGARGPPPEGAAGRPAAWWRCRRGARSRARPRCSRATTSSGPPVCIRTATAWPWSSGTTPTCRGTPRPSSCCPWHGSPGRAGARTLEAAGAAWLVAGGPEESVGQPAWRARRYVALRLGPAGLVAALCPPGAARTAAARPARSRDVRGRVPRAGLGARADDHGRAGRRHGGRPHDRVRPRRVWSCWRPAGPTAAPPQLPTAVRLGRRRSAPTVDGLALIGSTPDAPANVWVWTPDGPTAPLRPPARRRCSGAADVAVGEPFTLTGRSGRPVHGTLYRPTSARDDRGAGRPRRRW